MDNQFSRRSMMKAGGMIAVGLVAPRWLSTVAQADVIRQATGGKATSDTILVVCQFSGGNDGLNTVVPYAQKAYYDLRPTIGIKETDVLKLDGEVGLHPSLAGLHQLYTENKVAIVGNVGYPEAQPLALPQHGDLADRRARPDGLDRLARSPARRGHGSPIR